MPFASENIAPATNSARVATNAPSSRRYRPGASSNRPVPTRLAAIWLASINGSGTIVARMPIRAWSAGSDPDSNSIAPLRNVAVDRISGAMLLAAACPSCSSPAGRMRRRIPSRTASIVTATASGSR